MSTTTETSAGHVALTIAGVVDGLEALSAWALDHPDAFPGCDAQTYVTCNFTGVAVLNIQCMDPAELAAATKAIAAGAPLGAVTKDFTGSAAKVRRSLSDRALISAWAMRDEVCVRRVVGTETVEVPDPDAPPVTIERDVVEYDCQPIIGAGSDG